MPTISHYLGGLLLFPAFGIGSMVYSGLEFGRYFEMKNTPECYSNVLQAITPATKMLLTLVQVQFIFLNSKVSPRAINAMTHRPRVFRIPPISILFIFLCHTFYSAYVFS